MLKYSIIIAVYNRIDEVNELLASSELLDYDRSEFELLFVDDGSSDGFRDMIESYSSRSGLHIRALFQTNQGPGAARNYGMKEAEGEYFIFLDSDCMVPSHWLTAIDHAVKSEKLQAFGGPDTYHPSFSPLLKAINYSMTSFLGTGGTRGSKKSIGRYYPRSFNMGLHREVYHRIGGMNQLRHGQDMDFSARIYAAGFKVGLIAEAFVYHKRRTSLWKFFKQIFNWGVARINLGRLHPPLLKPIHFLPSALLLGLVLLLLLSMFFRLGFLWRLVGLSYVTLCLVALFQSLLKYKEIKVAFLSILTLNIQIVAYGSGLLYALLQSLWKQEVKGFTKNYYGNN